MKDEIIENARGVTCESCPYSTLFPGGTGYCHRFVNEYTGEFLRTSARAPACDHHPELQELKSSIETASGDYEGCDSRSGDQERSQQSAPSTPESPSSSIKEEENPPDQASQDPACLPQTG